MQQMIPVPRIRKKFAAACLASVLSFAAIKLGMDEKQIALITGPLWLFITAQGAADIGKEKAKIESELRALPKPTGQQAA